MPSSTNHYTERQVKLARLLAAGRPPAEAYREAGYEGSSRSSISRTCARVRPLVMELSARQDEVPVTTEAVGRTEIIRSLRKTRELARNPGEGKRPDLAAANKADELLGKSVGLFVDVHREEDLDSVIEGMSDAEIDRFMREQMQKFDPNYKQALESRATQKAEPDVPPRDKLN